VGRHANPVSSLGKYHVLCGSVYLPLSAAEYTDKKENEILLIYKEVRLESHNMRKGFLIYDDMRKY
jgi:hypothetical protein